jgi:hypothetical protein
MLAASPNGRGPSAPSPNGPASPVLRRGVDAENSVLSGEIVAVSYPRAAMIDFLKLLAESLAGLFRSCASREAEIEFSVSGRWC